MGRKMLWMMALVFLCALLFSAAAGRLSDQSRDAALLQLEDTVRKAAVSCYAADGVYPPDLETLEERCGLQINRERYTVHYEIFAGNRMPEITVLERNS